MSSVKTPKGKIRFKRKYIYVGVKQIDRDVALENLRIVEKALRENNIPVRPAMGTLLGIVRDGNFIEWDEDIDLFILEEERDAFLNALWLLKDQGFEIIRCERCRHLYSIIRNNEYIDFYVMEKISSEIRNGLGEVFTFDSFLTDLKPELFRGVPVMIPKEYDKCLTFNYGDWHTPKKYANFNIGQADILKSNIKTFLKQLPPEPIARKLLKIHHKKDLDKFIAKCHQMGITLKYDIKW